MLTLETDRESCERWPISSSVHAPTMGVLVHQCTCQGVDQTTTKPLSMIIIRESEAQVALQSLVRFGYSSLSIVIQTCRLALYFYLRTLHKSLYNKANL